MAFKRSGSRKLVYKKTLSKHTASKKKRVGKIRKSAFRAVSGIDQEITDGVFSKVQYQVEELDLKNEYNSSTSTFTPKQRGIYSLLASVSLQRSRLRLFEWIWRFGLTASREYRRKKTLSREQGKLIRRTHTINGARSSGGICKGNRRKRHNSQRIRYPV